MTSSTSTSAVIVLGDDDTGARVDQLATKAAEHGAVIAGAHTYEAGAPGRHQDLTEVDAVVAALAQAIGTRTDIWVPFPYDLLPEQHQRRLSLVLQRHGLNLLLGRDLWPAPADGGGYSAVDSALRAEVRAVDDLDHVALAAAAVDTLSREIDAALGDAAPGPPAGVSLPAVLHQLEVSFGPHPGLPATTAPWRLRQPALRAFAGWLVGPCELSQARAAEFLNAWGHRTRTGRHWQRATVSALVRGRS